MSVYPERVRKKRKVQHDSESYATQCEPPLTTGHGALDSIDNWQGVLQQNDNEHGSGGPATYESHATDQDERMDEPFTGATSHPLAQHIQDGASEPVIGATSYHAAIDNQDGASEPVTSITSHPLAPHIQDGASDTTSHHAAINNQDSASEPVSHPLAINNQDEQDEPITVVTSPHAAQHIQEAQDEPITTFTSPHAAIDNHQGDDNDTTSPTSAHRNTNARSIKYKSAMKNIHFNNLKPDGVNINYEQKESERMHLIVNNYKETATGNMHSIHGFGVFARSCKGPSALPLLRDDPNKSDTVEVDGNFSISHSEIIAAIRSHFNDTEQALYNGVMMNGSPHALIPQDGDGPHFYDNVHKGDDYSFIDDTRNHALSDPTNSLVLMNRILDNQELRAKWFTKDNNGRNNINIAMAKKWLQDTGQWCIKLCTLLHTTIGQPARGTEFASTNIRATAGGAGRGVMWLKNTVALLQTYSKTRSLTNSDTMIIRFCPRQVAEIVLQYLVFVRPFETALTHMAFPAGPLLDERLILLRTNLFVNNGKIIDTKDITNMLGRIMAANTRPNVNVGVRIWRHLCTWLLRKALRRGQDYERSMAMLNVDNDPDNDDDDQEDAQHTIYEMQPMSADQYRSLLAGYEQQGHTAHTAELIYGRLSNVPLQVPSDKFEQFYCTSLLWHSIIDMLDAPRMQLNNQENTRPSDRANTLCADYIARDAATRVSAQLVPVIGSIQRATNAYSTAVDINHQMAAQLATHIEMVATWMQDSHQQNVAAHQQLQRTVEQIQHAHERNQRQVNEIMSLARNIIGGNNNTTLVEMARASSQSSYGYSPITSYPATPIQDPPQQQPFTIDLTEDLITPINATVHAQQQDESYEDPESQETLERRTVMQCLAALHGPNAQPRSPEQYQAIHHSLFGRFNAFIVMPTGTGKSDVFFAPCMLPARTTFRNVTIVIVPLVSLLHDLEARARALRIRVYIWDKDGPTDGLEEYDLILVQMERCGHDRFRETLENLRGHIGRIIYDEAHMLVSDGGYRAPAVDGAISVRVAGVPIICLSATLPRSISSRLETSLHITHFIEIRPEHTVRPNIRYAKANISATIEQDTARIRQIIQRWASGARVIIYCGRYTDCRLMARQLNGNGITTWSFTGDMTHNQKETALNQWKNTTSEIAVMCGTTGFGAGIDSPDVRLIIHYGCIMGGIVGYAQQSGRSGRDGLPALALYMGNPINRNTNNGREDGRVVGTNSDIYGRNVRCRRQGIHRFIDNRENLTCLRLRREIPDIELCDLCGGRIDTVPESIQRRNVAPVRNQQQTLDRHLTVIDQAPARNQQQTLDRHVMVIDSGSDTGSSLPVQVPPMAPPAPSPILDLSAALVEYEQQNLVSILRSAEHYIRLHANHCIPCLLNREPQGCDTRGEPGLGQRITCPPCNMCLYRHIPNRCTQKTELNNAPQIASRCNTCLVPTSCHGIVFHDGAINQHCSITTTKTTIMQTCWYAFIVSRLNNNHPFANIILRQTDTRLLMNQIPFATWLAEIKYGLFNAFWLFAAIMRCYHEEDN